MTEEIAKPDLGDSSTWQTTTYIYDALSNLTQQTGADGVVTKYTYDLLGRQTEVIADHGARPVQK